MRRFAEDTDTREREMPEDFDEVWSAKMEYYLAGGW